MKNKATIDLRLLSRRSKDDSITINRNLFFKNRTAPVGKDTIIGDPRFRDPEGLDFRTQTGSAAIVNGHDIGAYDFTQPVDEAVQWWKIPGKGTDSIPP